MSVRNVLWICVLQLFGAERPRPQQKHTVEETLVDGLYGSVNKWSSSLGVDKGWRNFRTNEVVFSSPCIHEHVALNFSSYPFIVLVEPGGVEMFVTQVACGGERILILDVVATKTNLRNFPSVI
jgi:hypothetical protein